MPLALNMDGRVASTEGGSKDLSEEGRPFLPLGSIPETRYIKKELKLHKNGVVLKNSLSDEHLRIHLIHIILSYCNQDLGHCISTIVTETHRPCRTAPNGDVTSHH